MSTPLISTGAASPKAEEPQLDRARSEPEDQHWWLLGHSIFVIALLTLVVIPFSIPSIARRLEKGLGFTATDVVLGLVILVVLFDLYAAYQQFLIRRLRRQLAEKHWHSDLLRNLAMLDPLTGLYNRRFAEQRLAAEVSRSERKGHPLTVLTLDLNDFKEINDRYGHAAGDLVLQEFAGQLNKVIRGSDMAVRLGGDEFLVLLPECTMEQLELVVGRLGVMEVDWQGQKIPVTFSAGWNQYQSGESPDEMLARADEILYARKRVIKKVQATSKATGKAAAAPELHDEAKQFPLHALVDLTCPHCRKTNAFAVIHDAGLSRARHEAVLCAHCKKSWEPVIPGPVMAGPFPK
ncbi:MAG TPA: diguanylate cyclase [Candidatus Acidoferrum sp.]|nr:diguanylate cyclase [Candidatus Acidoferrum sp.]